MSLGTDREEIGRSISCLRLINSSSEKASPSMFGTKTSNPYCLFCDLEGQKIGVPRVQKEFRIKMEQAGSLEIFEKCKERRWDRSNACKCSCFTGWLPQRIKYSHFGRPKRTYVTLQCCIKTCAEKYDKQIACKTLSGAVS